LIVSRLISVFDCNMALYRFSFRNSIFLRAKIRSRRLRNSLVDSLKILRLVNYWRFSLHMRSFLGPHKVSATHH